MNLHSIAPKEDLTLLYLKNEYSSLNFVRVNPNLITYGHNATISGTFLLQIDRAANRWDKLRLHK